MEDHMKISYQLLLPLLCLTGIVSLHAMEEEPNFDITIYNDLKGVGGFYIPVQVTYTRGKTETSKVIQGNNTLDLATYKFIKADTPLIFAGYGVIQEATVKKSSIDRDILLERWNEVKESDKDKLVITITTEDLILPYSLTFSYSTEVPKKIQEEKNSTKNWKTLSWNLIEFGIGNYKIS